MLEGSDAPAPTRVASPQGAITLLAEDPRPPASRPLTGRPAYRARVGDYRIIYTIQDDLLLVVVVTSGERNDHHVPVDADAPEHVRLVGHVVAHIFDRVQAGPGWPGRCR